MGKRIADGRSVQSQYAVDIFKASKIKKEITMLLQETDGTYALTKSPALFNKKEERKTTNGFAVAAYAYGPPGPNGETADTPPDGYAGFKRQDPQVKIKGQAPFDIEPPESTHKLEHQETIVTANGMVAVVYRDTVTKEIILGFKGSASPVEALNPNSPPAVMGQSIMDWKTNGNSANGVPAQYKESAEAMAYVMSKYPDDPIVISGHSKGGGQVQYALMANRRAIEAREEREPRNSVHGVGINPAMPAGPMKDLIAKGLVDPKHPEKDEFAKKHIQLYAVQTYNGTKEILSAFNETVISNAFGGAYLGQTNILLTDENETSSRLDVASKLASFTLPWIKYAVKGGVAAINAKDATDNHAVTVASRAFNHEKSLPQGVYYKAEKDGNIDMAWAEDRNIIPQPGNIPVAQWKQARDENGGPKVASAASSPSV